MGGTAHPGIRDQGAHAGASRRLPRGVRSPRRGERRTGALGARRHRAQPDRLRDFINPGRQDAREEQIDDEPPSHIVVPAVHKLRGDVSTVFSRTIGAEPGNDDVHYLAETQRRTTRPYFLRAEAGMTGANFAVAETGSFVVCTNEGNADLSANVPKLHIASIGIEKIIPRTEHLGVFMRLLSRSALGSPITQYTSHFRAPRSGGELHIVLVDNGRSERLGMRDFWYSL